MGDCAYDKRSRCHPLTGGANDVWIFQIGIDLTVGDGAIVYSGRRRTGQEHVFWQVAGQATLGTTANVKGNDIVQNAGFAEYERSAEWQGVGTDRSDIGTSDYRDHAA